MRKPIPTFKSEEEEAEYWETHSITDHLDELEEDTEPIEISVTHRKKRPINIRIEEDVLLAIKDIAEELRLPYQTLIRTWLFEKLRKEYPETLKKVS